MNSVTTQDRQMLEDPQMPNDQQAPDGQAADSHEPKDQQALLAELGEKQEGLDALVGELRSLDASLEALASERDQHRLLHQACDALGALGKVGGAQLFWGAAEAVATGEALLRRVSQRVTAFESRVGDIEARRQTTRERIDMEQYRLGLIQGDLLRVQEDEERLQQEWLVEREIIGLHSRPLTMPWTWGGEDDRRFQKSLLGALAVCLLVALVVFLIRLPEQLALQAALPEQVLHITMALPRPPPPRVLPPPPPQPIVQKTVVNPTPPKAQQPPTEEPAKPAVEEPKPAGLLPVKQRLSALAQAQVAPALSAHAHINSADSSSGSPQRSMLTTTAPGNSGGSKLAAARPGR